MTFHVDSEVGRLDQVIVHRPGLELTRLTPQNVDDLLFDDVMWAAAGARGARRLRRRSCGQGRRRSTYFARPARRRRSTSPVPASSCRSELTTATRFGPALDKPLDELVDAARRPTARRAARSAACSSATSHLPKTSSLLLEYLDDDDFLLTPLPNHLFQRDNSAWVYDGLSVNPMTQAGPQARDDQLAARSGTSTRCSATTGLHFYYGNDDEHARARPTVEGGDILVIGNGAVMIGMGERTTPQGVEILARQYFAARRRSPRSSPSSCRRPARSCTSTPR